MRKPFILRDLLAENGVRIYPHGVPRTFRQRLGERYVVHRSTKAKISVQKAKIQLNRDRSVVKDIESGDGNPGIAMFEEYALLLGTTFEAICYEAMAETPRQKLDPDERDLLLAYQDGKTHQREAMRALVRSFRAGVESPPERAAPPSTSHDASDPRPQHDAPTRTGRGRR